MGKGVEARCVRSGWCPLVCSAQRRGDWDLKHKSLQNCKMKQKLSTITFDLITTSIPIYTWFLQAVNSLGSLRPMRFSFWSSTYFWFPLLLMIPGLTGLTVKMLKPHFPPCVHPAASLHPSLWLNIRAKLASMVTTKIGKGDYFGLNLSVQQDQIVFGKWFWLKWNSSRMWPIKMKSKTFPAPSNS